MKRAANACPDAAFAVLVEGNLEAMVTADRLLDLIPVEMRDAHQRFGLLDATGRIFPVHEDSNGKSHIFDAAELCLLDYLPAFATSGVDMVLIDARLRGPEYTREMVALYREARDARDWVHKAWIFASSSTFDGVGTAAVIAAILAPIAALQGFAFANYTQGRKE